MDRGLTSIYNCLEKFCVRETITHKNPAFFQWIIPKAQEIMGGGDVLTSEDKKTCS
jgi:hypothetical protein